MNIFLLGKNAVYYGGSLLNARYKLGINFNGEGDQSLEKQQKEIKIFGVFC